MAMIQTDILPDMLGFGFGSPLIARSPSSVGLVTGIVIGAFQGWLVGYLTIPAFIVTLGGLLVWRNVAWYLTSGQTIGPLDETFTAVRRHQRHAGRPAGPGWSACSASLAAFCALWHARRAKVAP